MDLTNIPTDIANKINDQLLKREAVIRNRTYLAKYKHGLMGDTILHLADGEDPVKAALAECRRCSGETNLLNFFDAKFVVESVELVA